MVNLKRILVPTDFSEASELALHYGLALAELTGASLHVLHVHEIPPSLGWGSEIYVPSPANFFEELEREARDRLERILTEEQRRRFDAKSELKVGSPFLEIIQYAKDQDIDLIVLGSHGRGAVAHMLLGSVAERVVRKGPCPVLTVRSRQHDFVMP